MTGRLPLRDLARLRAQMWGNRKSGSRRVAVFWDHLPIALSQRVLEGVLEKEGFDEGGCRRSVDSQEIREAGAFCVGEVRRWK